MDERLKSIKEDILRKLETGPNRFEIDFSSVDEHHFRKRIEFAFRELLKRERMQLKPQEEDELLSEVVSELLGLGPIDKLLKDPTVSEVMVNGPGKVYVERRGMLELTDVTFKDNQRLAYFVEKIISAMGRRITELEPYVDARLKDGSRVNVVSSPISSIGLIVTIRKFSHRQFNMDDLIKFGTLNQAIADFLKACVKARVNIMVSGGAGSGKSTLLNIMGAFLPTGERILTIEDTRELHFVHDHTLYLETRPSNIEGKGEITIRELVKNALHMRPDRIIIGEVRGDEVLDMIQAMNTGHDGSMTTLHANSPLEAMDRLEVLTLMGSSNLSSEVAKRQVINAVDMIVHMTRFPDGSRKLTHVSQVIKHREYELEDIFLYDENIGKVKFTGKAPFFYNKLKQKAGYANDDFEKAKQ